MSITMMLITLVLAHAYASQHFESPWEMSLITVDSDCPQLCGNWSALFLSDRGCKGRAVEDYEVLVAETRFCPDKQAVEAWNIEKELVYLDMYKRSDSLSKLESETFTLMTYEREMKLSVHPWQKFSTLDLHNIQETRRIKGSSAHFKCRGDKTGTRHKHYENSKPSKVSTDFSDDTLRYIELKYPAGGKIAVGTVAPVDSVLKKQKLADCVTVVFMKYDGTHINGIQFLSQGQETRFFGSDVGGSYVYVAPAGHCLADTRIRGDDVVDRLCIRFNVEE